MGNSAIYITNNSIRLTQADADKTIKEYRLDITSIKKEEIPSRLKAFLKENKIICENLTLYIPRHQVSVRYLNLPSVYDKEIEKMIEYELNSLFPYKPEELIFDDVVIERSPEGYSKVMLVAIQREVVLREISLLKQAGLVPEAVDISTVSLFNQFCEQKKESKNYLLINVEDGFLDFLVVHNQKLVFSRGVIFSQEESKQRLIKEVREIINIKATEGIGIDRIALSGRGVDLKALHLGFEQDLSDKVELNETICVSNGLKAKYDALNIDLLPEELKMQEVMGKRRMSVIYLVTLLALNVSLIASLSFLKIRQKQEYLYYLKSEIRKIGSESQQLQKKMLKAQILKGYSNSGRLTLGLLADLYRIAPSGLYLTYLEIRGQTPSGILLLTGQAQDTETVLKFTSLIKGSPLIDKADVNYIKKKQSQLKEEVVDFEIRCNF